MMKKKVIVRACTVSQSIGFVSGMLPDLCKKYEVLLLSSPGPELENAKEIFGVKAIAIQMERHISMRHDIVSLWKIIKAFRKEKPDMIHSMTPKAGLLCMVASWLVRVPVRIHTFTGLVFPTASGVKKRVLMLTDSITCFCATHVIPEGEGVKKDLQINGITKKPMRVLGYGNVRGIDMQRYSLRPAVLSISKQIRDDSFFSFLFVGRVVRDKGINELAVAFQRLNQLYHHVRLLLVGEYEDGLDPISTEARKIISGNSHIIPAGLKCGDELIAYYAASDCFVFPSYREGFPNTVLEAGAMGLPSIVTDINGSREIVEDGKNGIIIPSKDEHALFEAMKKMVEDGASRKIMAANARPMIEKRFEQGYVRQCLYNFYDEILPHE